ncbi:MAG: hypothetical protein WCS18_11550 [Sphaerochaetaceae bacterium]
MTPSCPDAGRPPRRDDAPCEGFVDADGNDVCDGLICLGCGLSIDPTPLAEAHPDRYLTILADLADATRRPMWSCRGKLYCECLRNRLIHSFVVEFDSSRTVLGFSERTSELPHGDWKEVP